MEAPRLSFEGNYLHVNGRLMSLEQYKLPDFGLLIRLGREALIAQMSAIHILTIWQNPDSHVQRPSIGMMNVGRDTQTKPVLTEIGQRHGTGWYQNRYQISERVRPYWDAVLDNGFIPEVRLTGTSRSSGNGVHFLFLRDTPYEL